MEPTILENQPWSRLTDRRQRSRRFAIAAQAHFSWMGPDGVCHAGKGTTRDISLHGIFIRTHSVPMPGNAVEVNVSIPSLVTSGVAVRLKGAGTVLRVDPPDSQPIGFAAEVNFQTTGTGVPFDSDSEFDIH